MRINITTRIFRGFLVIICLNALFVLVVSRLSSLNTIAELLTIQHEIKNKLLHFKIMHNRQNRARLIYNELRDEKYVKKFTVTGEEKILLLDSVIANLNRILALDSLDAEKDSTDTGYVSLLHILDSEIKSNDEAYQQSFLKYSALSLKKIPKRKRAKKIQQMKEMKELNTMIDTAGINLSAGLLKIDELIDDQTSKSIQDIRMRIDNVNTLMQIILLGMSVFSIAFALLFSRFISKHLRRLKESTNTIAKGNFDFNPRGYPNDEIGDLANAFFDMAYDLKKTQDELIKKRRLAAIGEIVASVNHEINNPLMIISGNAQFLEMTIDRGITQDTKERIHAIIEETERISQVTRKLRDIKNPVVEDYTSSGERMINLDKSSH